MRALWRLLATLALTLTSTLSLAATIVQANGDPIPTKQKICVDAGQQQTGGLAAVFASATCSPASQSNIGAPCNTPEICAAEKARILASGVECETTWLHGVNDDGCAIDPTKGEVLGLDPWRDVQDTYNTFRPLSCPVTFAVLSKGTALFQDAFGWYNVDPARAPGADDLHVVLGCSSAVGASVTLDVTNDPAYAGGEIGYFLLTPEDRQKHKSCAAGDCCASLERYRQGVGYAFFTQPAHNPEGLLSGKPYVHFVAYDSRLRSSKFYFAWEDLFEPTGSDFTDVVVSVEGAACSGGGEPCTAAGGLSGACALGTTACKNGALSCVPQRAPTAETCNGVDDDCNGAIDDAAPCDGGKVCFHGRCQPQCGTAEFVCPTKDQRCDSNSGLCVDAECLKVSCAAHEACVHGACVAPCADVTCPSGQVCLGGECVDLCAGVSCVAGEACVAGACVPGCTSCGGLVCASPLACDTTTGACVDPSCPYRCPAGSVCDAGKCADACSVGGVRCPAGKVCSLGACIAEAEADEDGNVPIDFGGRGPTGSGASGGSDSVVGSRRPREMPDPGCACRSSASSSGMASAWLIVVGCWLAAQRRRKNA